MKNTHLLLFLFRSQWFHFKMYLEDYREFRPFVILITCWSLSWKTILFWVLLKREGKRNMKKKWLQYCCLFGCLLRTEKCWQWEEKLRKSGHGENESVLGISLSVITSIFYHFSSVSYLNPLLGPAGNHNHIFECFL